MTFATNFLRMRWPVLGLLTLASGWAFHVRWIAPLQEKESTHRSAAAGLRERIGEAQKAIAEVRVLDTRRDAERHEIKALFASHPNDAAVVWFPERMKQHFTRAGFAGAVTRMNTTRAEAGLPGFERSFWAVEVPVGASSQKALEACLAVAEIEPLDPAIRVLDVTVHPPTGATAERHVVMNLALLSRKSGGAR